MSPARIVAAALLAAACAGGPPPPEGPPPARLRGLDFEADLQVRNSRPVELGGIVRVQNRGAEPETLVFADGCPVRLRAYDVTGARVAPVWEGPTACAGGPVSFAVAPGETGELEIPRTSGSEILGRDLDPGRYRLTVYLAPDDRVVEIEAGELALPY